MLVGENFPHPLVVLAVLRMLEQRFRVPAEVHQEWAALRVSRSEESDQRQTTAASPLVEQELLFPPLVPPMWDLPR